MLSRIIVRAMRPGSSTTEEEVKDQYFNTVKQINSIKAVVIKYEELIVSWKNKFKQGRMNSDHSIKILANIETKLQAIQGILLEAQRELETLNKEKELS